MRALFLTLVAMAILAGPGPGARAGNPPGLAECTGEHVPLDREADRLLAGLGRDLFHDPILSGNRNVACATCHHPAFGTSDGVALSLGDGGAGMGPARHADTANLPERRIPRNAQSLFNLGYRQFSVLFHDGRVEMLEDGRIRTPLGNITARGPLPVLTALSFFPVISPDEMAGHYSENDIAQIFDPITGSRVELFVFEVT